MAAGVDLAGVELRGDLARAVDLSAIPVGGPCQHNSDCDPGQICAVIAAPQGICTRPCSLDAQCGDLSQGGIPSVCMTTAAPAGCSRPCVPVNGVASGCTGGYVCAANLVDAVSFAECAPPPANIGSRFENQSCNGANPCVEGDACSGGFCKPICRTAVPSDCVLNCNGTGSLGICS